MPSSGGKTCALDRKSTRLNSSHTIISYAVFCLKKQDHRGQLRGHPRARHRRPAFVPHPTARGAPGSRPCASASRGGTEGAWGYALCFFNDTATTEIYTLSLHDALPI